jgi:hypothetical protein
VLRCPFCEAPETDRIEVEGRRFLVFRCLFTPEVEPALRDEEIAERLVLRFGPDGSAYFRGTCDRLHVYVTKGEGARILTEPRASSSPSGEPQATP